VGQPPEGKRRGLRRFGRRRKKAEAAVEPADVADEPSEDEPVAEAAPAEPPEPAAPDPVAELDARFDAARERLRAKIAPPDPED
jgi:hypothetical protein